MALALTLINIDSTINMREELTAEQAARLLGVKRATLYAYASRGLLNRLGRGSSGRYAREDVERLLTRHRARAGHGAVAAGALRFGDPVLDTSITEITEHGPRYRGELATTLAESGVCFEAVAELLWTGSLNRAGPCSELPLDQRARNLVASIEAPLDRLSILLPLLAQRAPERHATSAVHELELARRLLASLFARCTGRGVTSGSAPASVLVARRLGARGARAEEAVNAALVLLADHELNASTFAARVAASTGADLFASLAAAVATVSGPKHGAAAERVEALLVEALALPRPRRVVDERARRGESVPACGHPLYPSGDPRALPLLSRARRLGRRSAACRAALAIADCMSDRGQPPNVDFALVALVRALELPRGTATLLFALGRSAGWVAHILEQRAQNFLLRPRARYVGSR